METDPVKQRSRQKRRERALQLQQEKQTREEEQEASGQDDQGSPPRSTSKDKLPRSKPKKGKSALFEEDVIDGFAILSFKTLDELEVVSNKNGCIQNKARTDEDISNKDNTNTKDTNCQDKNEADKIKKKKSKKNASINHYVNNCKDINDNAGDGNSSCAPSNNSINNNIANICNSYDITGGSSSSSGSGRVSGIITDSSGNNLHRHHQKNNGPLEPPRSASRDGLSDTSTRSGSGQGYVCDVESGDDKASESGSDLYSGIPVGGILNDLVSKNRISPGGALKAPTPPPSTSTTPTPLCNGIVGSPSLSSPVPHVFVAAATTTTTTTTTSKPSLGEPLTTLTAVTAGPLSSQSVIHQTQFFPDHQGSILSQFSTGSFLSQTQHSHTLSPNSQQLHSPHSNGESLSCARSLQYSKIHKPYHINSSANSAASPCHSPVIIDNDTSPHRPHNRQLESSSENIPSSDFHSVSHGLNQQAPNLFHSQSSGHFPYHNHSPTSAYPSTYQSNPPHLHPETHSINHHPTAHTGTKTRTDQQCNTGSSSQTQISCSGIRVPVTLTASTAISNSLHPNHHHSGSAGSVNSHHRSSSSSSSRKSHTYTHHQSHHHQHNHQNSSHRPGSPLGCPTKRPCRTSPSVLPSPSTSLSPTTNTLPLSDTSKHFITPLPPKPIAYKSDIPGHAVSGRDLHDARSKEISIGHNHHHSSNISHHQHKYHRDKDRDRDREKDKEEKEKQRTPVSSSISLPPTLFPNPKPTWASTPGSLYNPLLQLHQSSPITHSSALHSLGPLPPQTPVTTHSSPLFSLPLAPPPPLLTAGGATLSAGMFAPPIHPAPPSLSSAPPIPTHPTVSSQFSAENLIRSQDFLHQDLNNRLLAHRDSSTIPISPSSFVRNETHQHQHQHLHNHMHQHTYGGLSAATLVPPAPPLFDKIPKAFEAGVFRPSIVPSYSAAFSSLLPPGPSGASLTSSLQGAFQPKSLVLPGQMLVPFRDREKAVPPPGLPLQQKKQGKWCAVHVRVAWEIYHRQQKKLQRDQDGDTASSSSSSSSSKSGPDNKPLEPLLRPPSNLIPGTNSTARPPESSLLSSVSRTLPDGIAHPSSSFLSSPTHLGMAPYPRPSPYPLPSLLNPLGFSGVGGSIFSSVRDMVPHGLSPSLSSSPHEWNRLHRTPSSFPSWTKSEAEKEREREIRKEEERERERRGSLNLTLSGLEDSRHKELESSRPKSRSRSRSPIRNGRVDLHPKPESTGSYDRRYDEKRPLSSSTSSSTKLKEERREDDMPSLSHHLTEREKFERERMERERLEKDRYERDRLERERLEKEKLLHNAAVAEREKLLHAVEQREKYLHTSGYLGLSPFCTGLPTHPGLLDRRVGLMGPPGTGYPFLERPPVPTSMWNPFDKSSAEIAHRIELERERERIALMSRLSSIPSHLAALEQERLKEQILRDQQEREYELRRQYFDRLPAFTADRLRAVDPLALGSYFPRTVSPMLGPAGLSGLTSSSLHGLPGAPPPLIPSSSSNVAATMLSSRSHNNSPSSSSKSKGCSPADSTSDLKDKREGSSTDPDAHSR